MMTVDLLGESSLSHQVASNTLCAGFPGSSVVKNLPAMQKTCAGNMVWIPGSRRSPGGGNENPLQYSCLGNPMDREPGGLLSMGSQVRPDLVTRQRLLSVTKFGTMLIYCAQAAFVTS